jgi:hypothetical protein
MSPYAVLDVVCRSFVVADSEEWLFERRAVADAVRSVEYDRVPGTYLIVEVEDRETTPEEAVSSLDIPDGPVFDRSPEEVVQ